MGEKYIWNNFKAVSVEEYRDICRKFGEITGYTEYEPKVPEGMSAVLISAYDIKADVPQIRTWGFFVIHSWAEVVAKALNATEVSYTAPDSVL